MPHPVPSSTGLPLEGADMQGQSSSHPEIPSKHLLWADPHRAVWPRCSLSLCCSRWNILAMAPARESHHPRPQASGLCLPICQTSEWKIWKNCWLTSCFVSFYSLETWASMVHISHQSRATAKERALCHGEEKGSVQPQVSPHSNLRSRASGLQKKSILHWTPSKIWVSHDMVKAEVSKRFRDMAIILMHSDIVCICMCIYIVYAPAAWDSLNIVWVCAQAKHHKSWRVSWGQGWLGFWLAAASG